MPEKPKKSRPLLSELRFIAERQENPLQLNVSVTCFCCAACAAASKQLRNVGRIKQITLIAELAIDLDLATMLDYQLLSVFLTETDQGIA